MSSTIVVVEDDKNINEVVTEYLKDAKYTVFSFLNGKEALTFIENTTDINLFIFDIMLPEVTGVELLKAVRANEIYQETPVLMLTALSDEQTQLTSFDELADDFVNKLFLQRFY
jgi:DNA-binding response OmpR family regulator